MKLKTLLLLVLFVSSTSFATMINIYDQPKADAKLIGTIDSEKGIIPIFTPKDSQWVKIADPTNGNVGWAKSSSLTVNGNNGYMFSISNQGSTPNQYILQFGVPKPLTDAQLKEYNKKLLERQQAIQKDMRDMMQNIYGQMNEMAIQFPMIMPTLTPIEPKKPDASKK